MLDGKPAVLHGNTYQRNQEQGDPCTNLRKVRAAPRTNFKCERYLMEWLMIWTMLILFPPTSFLIVRKLRCMCLKTTKQWSRWSYWEEDMFPEPTELLLIGCLTESIWTPRSKSNTLTPKTNSQTYRHREISHVMNGIIFCVCSTSAISVLPVVLKLCRKERKKMQVKKESQQNRSRWWILSRDAAWGIRTCLRRLHRKVRWKPHLKVRTYFWAR